MASRVAERPASARSPSYGLTTARDAVRRVVHVTCRRWNSRQCTRTRLTPATTSALFILDGLGPIGPHELMAAGDDLATRIRVLDGGALVASRLITAAATGHVDT